MRDIKFRAWDGKQMYYWGFVEAGTFSSPPSMSNQKGMFEMPQMQFTGLLDKNGKEIYESDILGLVHKNNGLINTQVVIWNGDDGCWDWEATDDGWPDGFSGFRDEYEVIGNIYENSELLSNNKSYLEEGK